jgi:NAD(P)-dependent dehydrogenase (short-subunit alcohol dehydrogenase family)
MSCAKGRIDVLANNAGYLCGGAIEEVPAANAQAQFETSYFGVARMTAAVLPGMCQRRARHIIIIIITISSLSSLVAVPFWGHYSASKFAVEGVMETPARGLAVRDPRRAGRARPDQDAVLRPAAAGRYRCRCRTAGGSLPR